MYTQSNIVCIVYWALCTLLLPIKESLPVQSTISIWRIIMWFNTKKLTTTTCSPNLIHSVLRILNNNFLTLVMFSSVFLFHSRLLCLWNHCFMGNFQHVARYYLQLPTNQIWPMIVRYCYYCMCLRLQNILKIASNEKKQNFGPKFINHINLGGL